MIRTVCGRCITSRASHPHYVGAGLAYPPTTHGIALQRLTLRFVVGVCDTPLRHAAMVPRRRFVVGVCDTPLRHAAMVPRRRFVVGVCDTPLRHAAHDLASDIIASRRGAAGGASSQWPQASAPAAPLWAWKAQTCVSPNSAWCACGCTETQNACGASVSPVLVTGVGL
jgi:hypothetical protein